MNRRTFVCGLTLGTLAAPLAGEAQQAEKAYRLAVVHPTAAVADMTETKDPGLRVVLSELRRLGYTEGQNLVVERWSGGGRRENYPGVAQEVVRWKPNVIFAGSGRLAQAFRPVTSTIPIVTVTTDPVGLGLATTLARPGGNVTGFSLDAGNEIMGKRLELLKEIIPKSSRIAYLAPRAVWEGPWGQIMRDAGARVGVTVLGAPLSNPLAEPEYRRAFAAVVKAQPDGLIVSDHAEGISHRQLLVALATEARLPAMFSYRVFAEIGGLVAYATDPEDISRQVAGYVDRLLRGAKPGELPFQQPTKFELVINRKTAKALGLTIPQTLLLRADQVIE